MTTSKSKAECDETAIEVTCEHHWVIDSPEGPTSTGICKLCGAEEQFQNYISYPSWHDTKWRLSESRTSDADLNKAFDKFPPG
jgi:hypothetical protein